MWSPRKRLLAVALGAAILAAVGSALFVPHNRITEGNSNKIKEGMTQAEVEAILGRPPGNYASSGTTWIGSGPSMCWVQPEGWSSPDEPDVIHKGWISDEVEICVSFDQAGRVTRSRFGRLYHKGVKDIIDEWLMKITKW